MSIIACAVPHGGQIEPLASESWLNITTPENHSVQWRYIYDYETATARHRAVQWAEEIGAEWLFQTDSDCVQPPDVLSQLLSVKEHIVTGVYRKKQAEVAYELYDHRDDHYHAHTELQQDPYPVDGCGAGCLLIHIPTVTGWGAPWFLNTMQSKTLPRMTEDLFFCSLVRSRGGSIWCQPRCRVGHVGKHTYTV